MGNGQPVTTQEDTLGTPILNNDNQIYNIVTLEFMRKGNDGYGDILSERPRIGGEDSGSRLDHIMNTIVKGEYKGRYAQHISLILTFIGDMRRLAKPGRVVSVVWDNQELEVVSPATYQPTAAALVKEGESFAEWAERNITERYILLPVYGFRVDGRLLDVGRILGQ